MTPNEEVSPPKGAKRAKTSPEFPLWVQKMFEATEEGASSKPLKPEPGLYLVATPIGNLGDISLRALWLLRQADAVLCEDTRVTGGLLHLYGIKTPLLSCHDHNETQRTADVVRRLAQGACLALVSDAGTPLLSDPGFKLVQACRAAGLPVFGVPGASALLTALSCAGLPTDKFFFGGFLPPKSAARQQTLNAFAAIPGTLVFYEAPQRVAATLADLAASLGGTREAALCRELTKLYEEVARGTLADLAEECAAKTDSPKGEFVILVGPAAEAQALTPEDIDTLLTQALESQTVRDAAAAVAKATGLKKSEVYQRAVALKDAP